MSPAFLMLRRPLAEALSRYGAWIGTPELGPPREVAEDEALELALEGDQWKGLAVYVFSSGPWTVFDELSGGLGGRSADEWLRLADGGDLVYAAYNDAIAYGELVQVERGRLVRHVLRDEEDPGATIDIGRLPEESRQPMTDWTDIARWVDEKDAELTGRERGLLWIHEHVWPAEDPDS